MTNHKVSVIKLRNKEYFKFSIPHLGGQYLIAPIYSKPGFGGVHFLLDRRERTIH